MAEKDHISQQQRDAELLLHDPVAFYGKSGNWLSRLMDRFLRFVS